MSRGFTLLEVLVALAVTALALTLGLTSVRGTAQRLSQVELTVGAEWVLENLRQEMLLAEAPPAGGFSREETMLGQAFVTQLTPAGQGRFSLVTAARERPQAPLAVGTLEFRDANVANR